MGRMIDDDIKQQLLDALAKEPPMVISTAYAYAKNYVNYGEDITKSWTTAVQQASIIEKVKINAQAEAYDSFKKDYETRLKADKAAMLEELKKEFEKNTTHWYVGRVDGKSDDIVLMETINDIIQQKIDKLKGEQA